MDEYQTRHSKHLLFVDEDQERGTSMLRLITIVFPVSVANRTFNSSLCDYFTSVNIPILLVQVSLLAHTYGQLYQLIHDHSKAKRTKTFRLVHMYKNKYQLNKNINNDGTVVNYFT